MEENASKQVVYWDISVKTLIKIIAVIGGIVALFVLREVIISLFVAIILMSAIGPLVGILKQKFRLSTTSAIAVTYLITISILTTLIYIVVPPLLKQLAGFFNDLPRFAQGALTSIGFSESDEQMSIYRNNVLPVITEKAGQVAEGVFGVTVQLFSGVIDAIAIAVFTFYLLLEREQVEGTIVKSIPFIKNSYRKKYKQLFDEVQIRLGHWARGQITLCIIIGVSTYIGLLLLGVPYALPLAVIAGILEMVPTIGPIISAVPALIIILAVDPSKLFFVLALYLVIQQLENSFIVPQVMKKALGFSPLITILSIMIGGRLLGIWGALLAVPFTVVLLVIAQNAKKIERSVQSD